MKTTKKYNLDKLTESHIDELCKDENVKEILIKAGVVPKNYTGWFGSRGCPDEMLYFENGLAKYGIGAIGCWYENISGETRIDKNSFPTNPLQHLIKEAVKRGFVEGCRFKDKYGQLCENTSIERFEFNEGKNSLLMYIKNVSITGNNFTNGHIEIMKDGVWSEIISTPNEIKVNNPQTVEYVQNGVFVPASVIKDTPNSFDLGEVVRRKFNEKSE